MLGSCAHMKDLEESLGSWLQNSPALAIVILWGLNQVMESLSLSLLFVTLSNKKAF